MSQRTERHRKLRADAATPEDLVRACLRGDEAAWRDFLDRYADLIYSVPLRMGVARSDAEEIFQASVLALYERLHTLQDSNKLIAWICEVARRQTLYYLRKRRRDTAEEEDEILAGMVDPSAGAADAMVSLEASQYVRDALLDIAPRCRRLLTALYLDDPTPGYVDLAHELEIAVGSIGPTRARCLKALRERLAANGYVEDAR